MDILTHHEQMLGINRRRHKAEVLVELNGGFVLGLNHHGSCGDDRLCLQKSFQSVLQQAGPDASALLRLVDRQTGQQCQGDGMLGQSFGDSGGNGVVFC